MVKLIGLTGEDLFGGLDQIFRGQAFLRDAKAIAQIADESFSDAMRVVEAANGFLSATQLRKLLRDVLPEKHQTKAFVNFIFSFAGFRHGSKRTPEKFAGQCDRLVRSAAKKDLTDTELERLSLRLKHIIEPKQAVEMHLKAMRIAKCTGEELESLTIVCDLRPVFDENRELIQGMIPVTTLVFTVTSADSLPKHLELHLSDVQLKELAEKANTAQSKLSALRSLLAVKQIATPDVAILTKDQV